MTTSQISSLDAVREQNPDLGFSVYALEPGGPVTLEIVAPDEQIFTFKAATLEAALLLAFPPDNQPAEPDTPTDIFE